jgi:protein-disulfide isomerase
MKYAQLLIGLLAGTALGGSVIAGTGISPSGSAPLGDAEATKQIVRDVIMNEPKLIIESVQKFQMDEQKKAMQGANEQLKDADVQKALYEDPNAAVVGNKNATRTIIEFFDYNCGACKMMFKSIDELLQKDKDVRVIFHEYPIFGPVSETNSKLGIAVWRLYPDQYLNFHVKMITHEGRVDEKIALDFAKSLGMDTDKIKAESEKPDVAAALDANRQLGEKLGIRGTPTLIVGDEIVPHALSFEELESRLGGTPKAE